MLTNYEFISMWSMLANTHTHTSMNERWTFAFVRRGAFSIRLGFRGAISSLDHRMFWFRNVSIALTYRWFTYKVYCWWLLRRALNILVTKSKRRRSTLFRTKLAHTNASTLTLTTHTMRPQFKFAELCWNMNKFWFPWNCWPIKWNFYRNHVKVNKKK